MKNGVYYFLQQRGVPLDLTIMFVEYLKDVITKELRVDTKDRIRQIMNELTYGDIYTYWLRFINRLKLDIINQENIKEEQL